ncbi:MAG TPA: FxSxx-COOH system tetratricopeptide repeat protein [Streptosporangiaceae bacterium]|nr:FxSxx-COOH system tetratricopeptide repeat protein [Streptosporangiaceae bacterium]
MALANVAWILASNGLRVLAVDWDLESPGLHKFFQPFLDEAAAAATPGVIDVIADFAHAATSPEPRRGDWHVEYARVVPHVVSLTWDHFPGDGTLDLLFAGRQNPDYAAAVGYFDWDNFYDRLGGGQFFDALREDMKDNYDYALIDSRTGLSDIAGICTIQLPDILVDCFTLNDQSIEGASQVARQVASRHHHARSIRILPVPMRIEDGEKEKLDIGRALARKRFDGFPVDILAERSASYWGSIEIPYKPYYAFEETLATFGDEPNMPASLLSAFERLTGAITAGQVTSMPRLPDEIRLRYRQAFTRRQPPPSSQVFLSYVPEDRIWADWIQKVLTARSVTVTLHNATTPQTEEEVATTARDLDAAARTVAVLSAAYLHSKSATDGWDGLAAANAPGGLGQLLAVRVDDVRLTQPFADLSPIDLAGLDAERATGALTRALGLPALSPQPGQAGAEQRYPGTSPTIWSVPARNIDFTGRGSLLELLRDQLVRGGTAVVVAQALYGMGGVGKTQLALEYAHRFKADYDLVWWIPAEGGSQISQSLAELSSRLGFHVGDNVGDAVREALDALRRRDTGHRWLLVFDNADDPKDLQPFLPSGPGDILITSRNHAWNQLAEPLEVDVFTREESIAHLLLHVPKLDPVDADHVANSLGDLPLAIEQAAAWLRETGIPAAAYAQQLDTEYARVMSLSQPRDYPVPAAVTWNMSLERLKERSPAAIRLLELLTFFAPGEISLELLYNDEMIQALRPFDETLVERIVLGRVIKEASRYALVRVDQASNSIHIHRLVQAVVRAAMSEDEQHAARHDVHKILASGRPHLGGVDNPANWPRYNWIWPHLRPSRAAECTDERTRQLLIEQVRYLGRRGELDAGLTLAAELQTIWTTELGANHRHTLHLRFQRANLLRLKGLLREARDEDFDVLACQRAALPRDDLHTLMTAISWAADLRALGEFADALREDKQSYELMRDQFGEEHPQTLAAANNLAVSLRLTGESVEARRIDRETLERFRAVLGMDHPSTLSTAANLARDMREAGEYRESIVMLTDTYDRYCAVLGKDSLDSLRTAKSLAVSLRKMGEQIDAKRLTEETYQHYLDRYGTSPPDAQACALNLACDYSALDDKTRAIEIVTDVLNAYQRELGEDHPYTLVAANNLMTYLRGTGEVDRATELGERTFTALRQRLGDDHPFTLSCAVNLANCLADGGQAAEAEQLGRDTYRRMCDKLGPLHPDTLVCAANLAVTLHNAGHGEEADELRDRTLTDFGRVLGEHPDAGRLREWRFSNRDLEPQPT